MKTIKIISASTLALLLAATSTFAVAGAPLASAATSTNGTTTIGESSERGLLSSAFWNSWRSKRPLVQAITPEEGPVGTTITLNGKRFNDESIVRFGRGMITDVEVADDGKTLSFVVPNELTRYCPPWRTCTTEMITTDPDEYRLRVQNGYRMSNPVWFEVTEGTTTPPTDDELSIDSITGPTALTIDEEGTWNLAVTSENDGNLQYSVKWGDEGAGLLRLFSAAEEVQSTSTFTHTYHTPGTYQPEFTVTDSEGNTVTKLAAPVVVGADTDVPHIVSIAPETTEVGATVTVNGHGFDASSTVMVGSTTASGVQVVDHTKLTFTAPTLVAGAYPVTVIDNDGTSNAVTLTLEKAASMLSITGINAPAKLTVGEIGTWQVGVASSNGGNLQYSVDWDEGMTLRAAAATQSSAEFTHTYHTPGTYTPTFKVTDEAGNSETVRASVLVVAVTE